MTISADAAISQMLDWVDNDNPMDDSDNDDDDLDDLYEETTIVRVPDCQSDDEDTSRKSDTDSSDEDVSPQQQTPVRRRHPKKTLTSNRLVNSIASCLNRSNFNEVTLPQNTVGNNEKETLTGFLGSKSKNNTPERHWTTTPPSTTGGRQRSCDVIKSAVSKVRYGNVVTDIRSAFNTLITEEMINLIVKNTNKRMEIIMNTCADKIANNSR